ncbi:hypothetical protein CAFE_16610 [Caprobacter fermentans]|uniref:Uncharacterized protein n=1 Tax=Caproicibacter fermentans TaxID=2576756 RepID=A0A6N8HZ27_9FIRM|nr:hypothetical protein [Caproicibacter fermentans]MVB10959.1 hypothetical protein [Caproicibacter fermentans]
MKSKIEEIKEKLKIAADRKDLVEWYTRSEDSFCAGIVEALDQEGTILKELDGQGRWCGYCFFRLGAIRNVETATDYLKKLKCYLGYWEDLGLFQSGASKREPSFDSGRNTLIDLLTGQCQEKHIITVGYYEEENLDTGYVLALTDRLLSLKTVDVSSGGFLEVIRKPLEDISMIEFDSIDNILLEFANRKLFSNK